MQYPSGNSLIKYRVLVEIEYFIALCEIPLNQLKNFPTESFSELRKLYQDFKEVVSELKEALAKIKAKI